MSRLPGRSTTGDARRWRERSRDAVRGQLQVRIVVTVLEHGGLPRGVYKNAIAAVREG
jgi:hypothetical protein